LAGCVCFGLQLASAYELREAYVGPDFFSKFHFWTSADPSQGTVEYVGLEEAMQLGLAQPSEASVRIAADSTTVLSDGQGRKSVRIQSRNAYNAGLFVAKFDHAPVGSGVWPAFWMYGEDPMHMWPSWGEYDIIEGVHQQAHTRTSLHTTDTCIQESLEAGRDFSGHWEAGRSTSRATVCGPDAPKQYFNQGCSQRGAAGSFGEDFNQNGGGTYAAEWDPIDGHIRTWFWPAGTEPYDLAPGNTPNPDTWDVPYSKFVLNALTCPPEHFANMRIVLNINFCGDLGDGRWEELCPDLAKDMTCSEFVARMPARFAEAYWTISRLDVYQKTGPFPPYLGKRIMVDFEGEVPVQPVVQKQHHHLSLVWLGVPLFFIGMAGVVFVAKAEFRRQRRGGTGDFNGWNSHRNMEVVVEEARAVVDYLGEQLRACGSSVAAIVGEVAVPPGPHLPGSPANAPRSPAAHLHSGASSASGVFTPGSRVLM